MNLRQLEAFYQVVLTGTVSDAARELSRTQPSVTALIKGLEESFGMPLFERRGRRLVPLPEAQYLFQEAKAILGRLERARETIDTLQSSEVGTLSIASTAGPSLCFLPRMINEILSDSDGVTATLLSAPTMTVHHLVASQQIDIGFGDMGFDDMHVETNLINHRLFELCGVVAVACDDPVASRTVVTPHDLSGRALALLSEKHRLFRQVKKAFSDAKAEFNARFLIGANIQPFVPIREGTVVGIIDPISARAYLDLCGDTPKIAFRPFEPVISYEIAVMTPAFRPPSRLQSQFMERLLARIPSYTSVQTKPFVSVPPGT